MQINTLVTAISIHSSCFSSETQPLRKCAKIVWSIPELTEVLQSITKLEYKVSFF